MSYPVSNTIRNELALDTLGAAITFCRATRGAWSATVTFIPPDVFEPVLRGLNVGYALGLMAGLQIPAILMSTYGTIVSDQSLFEKGVSVLANLGDVGASLAVTLQSVGVIVEVVKLFLQFTTPLLFVSITISSLHLAEYAKELLTKDPDSCEYKIAQLKAVATVITLIAVGVFLAATPANPALMFVGFGLCVVGASLNFRAAWIKYQASVGATDTSIAKTIKLRPALSEIVFFPDVEGTSLPLQSSPTDLAWAPLPPLPQWPKQHKVFGPLALEKGSVPQAA